MMKNMMMKLFALGVRVIILLTMAAMIFALRNENAKLKAENAALQRELSAVKGN